MPHEIIDLDTPGHRLAYLTDDRWSDGDTVLLCDPLTGLVAYPSFESYLREAIPTRLSQGVHLAIGDVDDLKAHVCERRSLDPTMFGHLAGNACMRAVGAITVEWADCHLAKWPFRVCGTFGGDEVIVAGSGRPYAEFVELVRVLAEELRLHAPRTCSFAIGSISLPYDQIVPDPEMIYRMFVAEVDAALFDCKLKLRSGDSAPRGEIVDIGDVDIAKALALDMAE